MTEQGENRITVGEVNCTVWRTLPDGKIEAARWHAENVDVTDVFRMQEAGCPEEWIEQALYRAVKAGENVTAEVLPQL